MGYLHFLAIVCSSPLPPIFGDRSLVLYMPLECRILNYNYLNTVKLLHLGFPYSTSAIYLPPPNILEVTD